MVRVKVAIPMIHKDVDFRFNQRCQVSKVMADMLELVQKKWDCDIEQPDQFLMYQVNRGVIFDPDRTFEDYQIQDGDQIMII